jgi:hypothetical protein
LNVFPDFGRELIGHPSRINTVDKNPIPLVIFGHRQRHHIQQSLGHIGMNMVAPFAFGPKDPFLGEETLMIKRFRWGLLSIAGFNRVLIKKGAVTFTS